MEETNEDDEEDEVPLQGTAQTQIEKGNQMIIQNWESKTARRSHKPRRGLAP